MKVLSLVVMSSIWQQESGFKSNMIAWEQQTRDCLTFIELRLRWNFKQLQKLQHVLIVEDVIQGSFEVDSVIRVRRHSVISRERFVVNSLAFWELVESVCTLKISSDWFHFLEQELFLVDFVDSFVIFLLLLFNVSWYGPS